MFVISLVSEPDQSTRVILAGAGGRPLSGGDDEIEALCRTADDPGRAGALQVLPRPLGTPAGR